MFGATQVQSAFQLLRDRSGLGVAHEEEERRSRKASENAPPAIVFHEEMADMVNRDQDDCGGFQPVGVVNRVRRALQPRVVGNSRANL